MSNLCDGYTGAASLGMALQTAGTLRGQTFYGNDEQLEYVNLYIDHNGSGNVVIKARIFEVNTGTYGTTAYGTGAHIAESTNSLNTNTLPSVGSGVGATRFDFPTGTILDSTKAYVVCAYVVSNATSSWGRMWASFTYGVENTAHSGNGTQGASGLLTGADQSRDFKFQVYTVVPPATSERSARVTGKSTSNSERSAKTRGKLTANSERSASLEGVIDNTFSREVKGSLPTNDLNLAPVYSAGDITDVSTDNDVYVDLEAIAAGYAIHQYKVLNTNNTDRMNITFKGRSSIAPSVSSVVLQVYNRNSSTWETVSTESAAGANTKFTMTGTVSVNMSNYYDANFIISIRIYQQVT